MLRNSIQKSIVTETLNNVSKMLVLQVKQKFAPCWIAALLVYAVGQTCSSVSFTPLAFLLDNFG